MRRRRILILAGAAIAAGAGAAATSSALSQKRHNYNQSNNENNNNRNGSDSNPRLHTYLLSSRQLWHTATTTAATASRHLSPDRIFIQRAIASVFRAAARDGTGGAAAVLGTPKSSSGGEYERPHENATLSPYASLLELGLSSPDLQTRTLVAESIAFLAASSNRMHRDAAWRSGEALSCLQHMYELALVSSSGSSSENSVFADRSLAAIASALASFLRGDDPVLGVSGGGDDSSLSDTDLRAIAERTNAVLVSFGSGRLLTLLQHVGRISPAPSSPDNVKANADANASAPPRPTPELAPQASRQPGELTIHGSRTTDLERPGYVPSPTESAQNLALDLATAFARMARVYTRSERALSASASQTAVAPDAALLRQLVAAPDPRVPLQVVRYLANSAAAGQITFFTLRHGGWDAARLLAERGSTPLSFGSASHSGAGTDDRDALCKAENVQELTIIQAAGVAQAARLLANVTALGDAASLNLAQDDYWRVKACEWLLLDLHSPQADSRISKERSAARLSAAVALANIAHVDEAGPFLMTSPEFVASFKSAVEATSSRAFSRSPEGAVLASQLARIAANLTSTPSKAALFVERFGLGPVGQLIFASYGDTYQQASQVASPNARTETHRECATVLANLSACDSFVETMVAQERDTWLAIYTLAHTEDVETQRQLARTIANLCANSVSAPEVRSKEGVRAILHRWMSDPTVDAVVIADAVRAHASLAAQQVRDPKYADGIYLLGGVSGGSSFPRSKQPTFDVVFIHGATGHPFSTWTQLTPLMENASFGVPIGTAAGGTIDGPNEIVWPRDWLADDLGPSARVISVGYNVHFSRWVGDAVPMIQQSLEMARKLKLAGVGQRPCVWVTHSMGGLLLKHILINAAADPTFAPLLTATKGIVFFSTPHRGADITTQLEAMKLQRLLRTTPAIDDLKSGPELDRLHDEFKILVKKATPEIPTLSFGENAQTCVGTQSRYTCFQLVKDDSANPSLGGTAHAFVKLDQSHRTTCKPLDRSAANYALVVRFIESCVRGTAPHNHASSEQ